MLLLVGSTYHPKSPWNVAVIALQFCVDNHYVGSHSQFGIVGGVVFGSVYGVVAVMFGRVK